MASLSGGIYARSDETSRAYLFLATFSRKSKVENFRDHISNHISNPMNYLFLTQSATLSLFYDLSGTLRKLGKLESAGFYISDSGYYRKYRKQNPAIDLGDHSLLKEWEILGRARNVQPDLQVLTEIEKKYGDPVLWNALVADRRIILGKRGTVAQDYASRFGHEPMLSILQTAAKELEHFFDIVQPDMVVGFICVTIGEYLASRIARYRGIPFCNLRPTRIRNYFYAGESVTEPSERLAAVYRSKLEVGLTDIEEKAVSECLGEIRASHAMYEGVIPADAKTSDSEGKGKISLGQGLRKQFSKGIRTLVHHAGHWWGKYRYDNTYKGMIYPKWHETVRAPLRVRAIHAVCRKKTVDPDSLESFSYAFFPLHKEPEVTLLVYGRPYQNQIEAVRQIARSLPVGMKLVIKEHPGCLGYRSVSYFKKLISIPNVLIAPPEMTSRKLVEHADLVTVIGGSIGLEAVLLQRPLIVLGQVPFAFFPKKMVRYIENLQNLANDIQALLQNHQHDESSLKAYLAAVIETSVPVDFYSVLIGRKGVYRPTDTVSGSSIRTEHLQRLAEYLARYRVLAREAVSIGG